MISVASNIGKGFAKFPAASNRHNVCFGLTFNFCRRSIEKLCCAFGRLFWIGVLIHEPQQSGTITKLDSDMAGLSMGKLK